MAEPLDCLVTAVFISCVVAESNRASDWPTLSTQTQQHPVHADTTRPWPQLIFRGSLPTNTSSPPVVHYHSLVPMLALSLSLSVVLLTRDTVVGYWVTPLSLSDSHGGLILLVIRE